MPARSQHTMTARRTFISLFIIASTFSGTAYAAACGDISPSLSALGDEYYDLDNSGDDGEYSTGGQLELLENTDVFVKLRNTDFRSGAGMRTRCFGTDENLRAETSQFKLEDINLQYQERDIESELEVNATEFDEAANILRPETIYLPSSEGTDIAVSEDETSLTVTTRTRQSTDIGSIFRETVVNVVATDTGVNLEQLIYANGYLAEWANWTLHTSK